MNTQPCHPPPQQTHGLSWGVCLFAVIAGMFAAVVAKNLGAYAADSDTSGYFHEARLLGAGRLFAPQRALEGLAATGRLDYVYCPLGFRPEAGGRLAPTYPSGFPLQIAALGRVLGQPAGAAAAIWLNAVGAFILTGGLLRACGVSWRGTLAASVVFGASPLVLFMGVQLMSDLPATAWVTGAVLAAIAGARRPAWAAVSGLVFSVAVLIRPTNLLAVLPVAILLGTDWRRWVRFASAGLPTAAFLAFLNERLYGSPIITGYGDVGYLFGAGYLPGTLAHYALWLPVVFTPLVALAPVGAWPGAPAPARVRLALVAWVVAYFGFYAFYRCTHEAWWYLRFVLPACPAWLALAALGADRLLARMRPAVATLGSLAVLACAAAWLVHWDRRLFALEIGRGQRVYEDACTRAAALPDDPVILTMQTSGALFYYTDRAIVRWDMLQPGDFARLKELCLRSRRPVYAFLFPFEEHALTDGTCPGTWRRLEQFGPVSIWRLETGAPDGSS